MSCTTDYKARGFTFVELMVVIALMAIVVTVSGTTVWDQLQTQRVADGINKARIMASAIEQVRPVLRKEKPTTFGGGSAVYQEMLYDFMEDMEVEKTIKDGLERFILEDEKMLGNTAGNLYYVTLTEHGTFVALRLGTEYTDYDFYSTAKSTKSGVSWTVPARIVDPSVVQYRFINELNNAQ